NIPAARYRSSTTMNSRTARANVTRGQAALRQADRNGPQSLMSAAARRGANAPLLRQISYRAEYGSGGSDQHHRCGPGASIELLSIEVRAHDRITSGDRFSSAHAPLRSAAMIRQASSFSSSSL